MSFEIGCVSSRAVRADCRQRGARSQTLRVRNGRPAIDPYRDMDLLGEPSVTNIDLFIPGHGPGTLLLVFVRLFHMEKSAKNREPCARTILQKTRGDYGQFSNFDFCSLFHFYMVGITECVILRVRRPDRGLLEASWRHNRRLVEAFWGLLRVSRGPKMTPNRFRSGSESIGGGA